MRRGAGRCIFRDMQWATPKERRNLGQARRKQVGRQEHNELKPKARQSSAAELLARSMKGRVPALIKLKYELMTESPPLTGLSQFAAAATNSPKAQTRQPAASLAAASPASLARGHLVRNLAVVLGIGIVFLSAATLVLKTRAGRRPR